jgi:hypothetical protein
MTVVLMMFFGFGYVTEDVFAQSAQYEEAASKLSAFGILRGYQGDVAELAAGVDRGKYVEMLLRALGYSNAEYTGTGPEGGLEAAVNLGIVKGYAGGDFGFSDGVTYVQGVALLVRILGYDAVAENMGGYPAGHMIVAAEKKITDGLNFSGDDLINLGTAVQMVYNALDVDLMLAKYGSGEKFITSGETLMSARLKIWGGKGVLTATPVTSLSGGSILSVGEVIIDGEIYQSGVTGAEKFLGYSVSFYYRSDVEGNGYELVYIAPQKSKNSTITVMDADIIKDETTRNTLVISEGEKVRKCEISPVADMIYNGKAYPEFGAGQMKPQNGEVTILDRDGDGIYDVVFVTSYRLIVADTVSISSKKVYDKYGREGILLDADSNDYLLSITKNGETAGLEDIEEWDVLSVAETLGDGEKMVTVHITRRFVERPATEVSSDFRTVVIDAKEYFIEPAFRELLMDSAITKAEIKISKRAVYYFDSYGRVAASDMEGMDDEDYGYLFAMYAERGLDAKIQFKIFTASGDWSIYEGAESIDLNGVLVKKDAIVTNGLLCQANASGEVMFTNRQMIKYELDKDGRIKLLKTAIDASGAEDAGFTKIVLINARYAETNYSFDSRVFVNLLPEFIPSSRFYIPYVQVI